MAAGTLKDFLIGVGFDVDSAGSAKAEAVLNNLNAIVKQLGQVLIATGNSVKGLIDSAASGAGSVEGLSEGLENTSGSAKSASKSLEQASQSSRIEGAKHGVKNISSLDAEFKKVTRTVKRYAMVAVTALAGSNIKTAFKQTIEFMNGLATAAKDLNKSYEATRAYNTALKVMGKTAQEIEKDASLKETFNTLQSLGEEMALPQAAQGVTAIRDLMGMFTQLKFTANYALQWILYKIQTVAEGPLANVRDLLTGVRNWFGKNMEKIATAIATGVKYAIQIFINLGKTIGDIIGLIDKLPDSIKIVGAVALAVIGMVKSKTFLITAIITVILLLIDDLRTYLEGGDSLFGDFWGKCIEWAEKVKPVVEDVIKKVGDFITTIGKGTTKVVGWLSKVGLLGPLLGGIAVALAAIKAIKIAASIKKAYDSFNNFLGVIKLTNPKLLLIGIIVAAVAAAAIYLIQNWDKVKAVAEKVWTAVSEYVTQAWDDVKTAWGSVVTWFSGKWNRISQKVSEVWADITGWISGAWDDVKAAWDGAGEWFGDIWRAIKKGVRNIWTEISQPFKTAWTWVQNTWNKAVSFFSGLWTSITGDGTLAGLWDAISSPFVNAWNTVTALWDSVVGWFSSIWLSISGDGTLSGLLSKISSPFVSAYNSISHWFSGIAGWFAGIWETIQKDPTLSQIVSILSGPFVAAATVITAIWDTITGFFSSIWGLIKGDKNLSDVLDAIKTPFINAYNSIFGIFNSIVSKVSGWFSGLAGAVSEKVGDVAEWATSAWATIQEKFENIKTTVSNWFTGIGASVSAAVGNVAGWAKGAWHTISGYLKNIYTNVIGWFTGIGDGVSKAVGKVGQWAIDAWADIESAFSGAYKAITGWFSGIGTWFEDLWAGIVNTAIDAINELIGAYNSTLGVATGKIGLISRVKTSAEKAADAALPQAGGGETSGSGAGMRDHQAGGSAQTVENLIATEEATESAAESFNTLEESIDGMQTSLESVDGSAASSNIAAVATSIDASMRKATASVAREVANIQQRLGGVGKNFNVISFAANAAYSNGGKVYDRTNATIGEDGPEYVIPLNKPNRAISLLQQAARDLGMNLGSAQNAMNLIGGRADANITPAYALPGSGSGSGNVTNNFNTINSPVTQNISGSNDQAIADMAAKDYERVILRNIKPILA